jgi:hypothetical protein
MFVAILLNLSPDPTADLVCAETDGKGNGGPGPQR